MDLKTNRFIVYSIPWLRSHITTRVYPLTACLLRLYHEVTWWTDWAALKCYWVTKSPLPCVPRLCAYISVYVITSACTSGSGAGVLVSSISCIVGYLIRPCSMLWQGTVGAVYCNDCEITSIDTRPANKRRKVEHMSSSYSNLQHEEIHPLTFWWFPLHYL